MSLHLVSQERFELPTLGLEGRCSIQLSYWPITQLIYYHTRWGLSTDFYEKIKKNNTFLGKFYDFIIMSAILTTAISQGYSYVEKYKNNKKMYKNKLILMLCVGIILMQYSFSNVMEFVYPIFGGLGFILCGYIMLKRMD